MTLTQLIRALKRMESKESGDWQVKDWFTMTPIVEIQMKDKEIILKAHGHPTKERKT